MDRFVDGVGGVANRAVDVIDRMAGGAGNPGFGGGMLFHVEPRIVERPAEEGHHVVAAGAPPRRPDVTIAA